ncbi:MAG: MFS transporter, partial [Candidatus Korarchaeum sp.]|nr:MFS transporter [Candidatus Korarchaeum sp.]MDW8036300.1 MFS transporter [Candidatus Korarchaeum sp.]
FSIGLASFSIFSLLIMISPDFNLFLALRFAQGVSSSMISATAVALVSEIFPKEERGKVLGINTASVYAGLSLGPLVGGLMADLWSWIGVFILSSLLSFSSFIISKPLLKLKGSGSPPNFASISLYVASMISLTYGVSSLSATLGLLLSSLGTVALLTWLLSELSSGGLLGPELLRNRAYLASSSAALLNYSASYAISIVLGLYLQRVERFSASEAGVLLTLQPIVQASLSPLAGYLADKRSPRKIASLGMGVIALGIAMLLPLTPSKPLTSLILSLSVLGTGFAFFASPNTLAALNASPPKSYGSANAFLGSMRFLGQFMSTAILMVLMTNEELLQALNSALLTYVTISISGAIMSALARSKKGVTA